MIIPEFTSKPVGLKINFDYGIGLSRVWEADFCFIRVLFCYTDNASELCGVKYLML